MYYPPFSRITENDLGDAYQALREAGATPEKKLGRIDVLIESYGGDPVAGYRLAQLIRGFGKQVTVLVAEHAYSAATLFAFAADQVRLAHYAGLSPIDITLVSETGDSPRKEVELATIDSVLDFAREARKKIEVLLRELGSDGKTAVDSDILVEMVKQVGALHVGKYYRERLLTGHYAEELLGTYMFAKRLNRDDCVRRVIEAFLLGAPGHEVHLDLSLAKKWGLAVEEMLTEESDLTKAVAEALDMLSANDVICPWLQRAERIPFIALYPLAQPMHQKQLKETQKEHSPGMEELSDAAHAL